MKSIILVSCVALMLNASSIKETSNFSNNLDKIVVECDSGKIVIIYEDKIENIFIANPVKIFDNLNDSILESCQNN